MYRCCFYLKEVYEEIEITYCRWHDVHHVSTVGSKISFFDHDGEYEVEEVIQEIGSPIDGDKFNVRLCDRDYTDLEEGFFESPDFRMMTKDNGWRFLAARTMKEPREYISAQEVISRLTDDEEVEAA